MLGERVGEREGGETGDRRELGIHCGLGVLKYHVSSFMRLVIFALRFFSVVARTAHSSVFALPGHPSLHGADFYRRVHQVPYLCVFVFVAASPPTQFRVDAAKLEALCKKL